MASIKKDTYDIWQRRCGHPSAHILTKIVKNHKKNINFKNKIHKGIKCSLNKMKKLPFKIRECYSIIPLEVIHIDVWSPGPITSTNGFR